MNDRTSPDWSLDRSHPGPDRCFNRSKLAHRGCADAYFHSLVHLDVAGSAARDSQATKRMRDDLHRIVAEVADDNDVDLALPYEDLGDGLRLVIPVELLRPTRVLDVFITGLAVGLREHRRQASEAARIRLRAGIDLGPIEPHRGSWTGRPLVNAARLVDADPLRQALDADRGVDLAAAVSDAMYQFVIRHRNGRIPPSCFQEVRVRVKEFDDRAWLLVPRSCVCATPHHGNG